MEFAHGTSASRPGKKEQDRDGRMADGDRAKRLKSSSEDGVVNAVRGLIANLESGNERVRRCVRQVEGNHEVLPVVFEVVVTSRVDLSHIDTGIVSQISSYLGTSHELLNLSLTCKSFGWRQPSSTLNWSLVEEVARQAVCSSATNAEMGCLPRYVSGTTTWLSILRRFERMLIFDVLLGGDIEHQSGDKTKVHGTGSDCYCTAVSSGHVMSSKSHYAEFTITGLTYIGIVRPMPNLNAGAYQYGFDFIGSDEFYSDFLGQRTDNWGDSDVNACEYYSGSGQVSSTKWGEDGFVEDSDWEGRERCYEGDTVGMLLNLDEGTLTVYKNNRRLGVMKDGLSGPYCWHASVSGTSVAINRGTPPLPTETML